MRRILRITALAGILRGVSRNAQKTLRDPAKMQKLAGDVTRHAAAAESKGGIIAATLAPVLLMGRMVRAYAKGEYRVVPWATMAGIVATLIYFVMPFDFVPDILAGFGLVDDLALVAFVMQKTAEDLQKFSAWDIAQRGGPIVDSVAAAVPPAPPPDAAEAPNPADSQEAMEAILRAVLGDKKPKA